MPRVKRERLPPPPPIVREVAPDVWAAGSRSRANHFHTVHVHREYGTLGFTCTCEAFVLGKGKECAHIRTVRETVSGRESNG